MPITTLTPPDTAPNETRVIDPQSGTVVQAINMASSADCRDCPSSEPASPCGETPNDSSAGCGDCGENISPVELTVDESKLSPVARGIRESFYTALELCFGELATEPKSILVVGGCRQREMARRLGFMLPYAKIFVLDSDAQQVERARHEIRCRFKFAHGKLSDLSQFENDGFDLVMAHNFGEYLLYKEDWRKATEEMARITKPEGALLISCYRPLLGKLLGGAATVEAMATLGCTPPRYQPSYGTLLKEMARHGVAKLQAQPFPWQMAIFRKSGLDY